MSDGGKAVAGLGVSGRFIVALVLVLVTVLPIRSPAAGVRDVADGWLVPPGAMVRLLQQGWTAGDDSPDVPDRHGRQGKGLWISCGQMSLYGMPELPGKRLAGGWQWRGVPLGLAWQRLGTDLLVEDQIRLRIGGQVDRRLRCAVALGWDAVDLAGVWRAQNAAVAFILRGRLRQHIRFEFVGHVLDPASWHGARGVRRWLLVDGRTARTAWAVALERGADGVPLTQAEVSSRLGAGCALGVRFDPASGVFGFTTAWRHRVWVIRSSHLIHPQLGVTHRWCLCAGSLEAAW